MIFFKFTNPVFRTQQSSAAYIHAGYCASSQVVFQTKLRICVILYQPLVISMKVLLAFCLCLAIIRYDFVSLGSGPDRRTVLTVYD